MFGAQVAVQEVRRLQQFGVTKGEMERYKAALLRDSDQMASQADSVASVDTLNFLMEYLALGHTVMHAKQVWLAFLRVASGRHLCPQKGMRCTSMHVEFGILRIQRLLCVRRVALHQWRTGTLAAEATGRCSPETRKKSNVETIYVRRATRRCWRWRTRSRWRR